MPFLPVSHRPQRQQAECLAACAAMALDYLGMPSEYGRLLSLLRIQEAGAPFRNLRHLESLGVSVLVARGELDTLRLRLEQGLHPIAFVATRHLPYWDEATGHAVMVIGMEGEWVFLNDPAFADAPKRVPLNEFELAWIDLDQFYALISLE